jgi:DnaJ-class molecular chaperone
MILDHYFLQLTNKISRATRKAILRLHPDRNPDDPNAASRFADFQAACKVFESEEKRRKFDDTGHVKEIDDLQARLQGLAMK